MRSSVKGFTLLEVMLVILLMGLTVSVVVMNYQTRSPTYRLDEEEQRFRMIWDYARQEAILSGSFLGVKVDKNQYQWLVYQPNKQPMANQDIEQILPAQEYHRDSWAEITSLTSKANDKRFAVHELDEDISLSVQVDGLPLMQSDNQSQTTFFDERNSIDNDDSKELSPQIYLFPSGESSSFQITFELVDGDEQYSITLKGDVFGRVQRTDITDDEL